MNKPFDTVFNNSNIKYEDIDNNLKDTINMICNQMINKKEINFVGIPNDVIIKLLNMTPELKNTMFENILFSKIINDINNDTIENFAINYGLDLDVDTNIIKLIELCYK